MSHRSATIGRRHIADLCTSVQIPEDHCSHGAPTLPFRVHCAPFHRERTMFAAGSRVAAIRAICPQFLKDPIVRSLIVTGIPRASERARDNGKRLGNRMHSREETRTSCTPGIFRSRGFAAYLGFVRDEERKYVSRLHPSFRVLATRNFSPATALS